MTPGPLTLSRAGEVLTLTLSAKMGALGPDFWAAMPAALDEARNARVLILRGETVFSAGLDVAATAPQIAGALGDPQAFAAVVAPMHAAIEGLSTLPIPVVAAVHGWCIGAGLELIAAADIRICTQDARFRLPEVLLGITADLGGLQRLPRLIGHGRAAHLALTGEPIGAETAERWGLVTEVLPDEAALSGRAEALAAHLAGLPPKALEGTKRALNAELSHAHGLAAAVTWNARHLSLADMQSALKR